MPRPRTVRPNWNELATIWRVSDALWTVIAPILQDLDPPKAPGRPRVEARATLDASIVRVRSGCPWNQWPERFPDDSSVHRTFPRWVRLGVFERIWSTLEHTGAHWWRPVPRGADWGGLDWEGQAVDGAMGKARLGGTSSAAIPPSAATPSAANAE